MKKDTAEKIKQMLENWRELKKINKKEADYERGFMIAFLEGYITAILED